MSTRVYIADVGDLKDWKLYKKLYDLMPPERKEKIDAYRFDKDKFLSIGVWALLVYGLLANEAETRGEDETAFIKARLAGEESHEAFLGEALSLSYGENNKPFFENVPALRFNLSHSGERAMCIISEAEVGCDIELKRDKCLDIADRFFFNEEKALINAQATELEKEEMFFRLWTLKESYMKATGLGFKLALNNFSVVPGEEGAKLTLGDDITREGSLDENYTFYEYDNCGPYKASCCIRGSEELPKLTLVNLKEVF